MLCGRLRLPIVLTSVCLLGLLNNLSDFCRLQVQCASCKLSIDDGCPPLFNGMMWSITGLSGSGALSVTSTGLPQIPQVFCVFSIIFRFFSYATRCGPDLSARRPIAINSFSTAKKTPRGCLKQNDERNALPSLYIDCCVSSHLQIVSRVYNLLCYYYNPSKPILE